MQREVPYSDTGRSTRLLVGFFLDCPCRRELTTLCNRTEIPDNQIEILKDFWGDKVDIRLHDNNCKLPHIRAGANVEGVQDKSVQDEDVED